MFVNFYKDNKTDKIWRVEELELLPGNMCERVSFGKVLFSFDKKNIFNLWTDYPHKLTPEQVELFKKEKPEWASFKA